MAYRVPVSTVPLLLDPPFVLALVWLGVAVGYRALRLLRVPLGETSRLERGALSAALGLGLLQYVAFGLGMAGALTPRNVWIALGALVVLSAPDMWRVARGGWRALQRFRAQPPAGWIRVGMALLLVPLAFALCQTLCPPTDVDGLGYHLTAPKRWLQSGDLGYLPTFIQTQLPMGVDMLFTLALAVWSDTAAKLIHYALGVWTLLAIFALGRRLHSAAVGFTAAMLFAVGAPKLSALALFTWAYIDLGIAFQIVCAVMAWVLWSRSRARGWLLCAGLLCGFAITYKISGLPLGFLLGALVVREHRRAKTPMGRAIGEGVALAGLSLLPVLPWFWRSWLLTGNPIWPMFPSIFPSLDWNAEVQRAFNQWMRYYSWGRGVFGEWDLAQRKMALNGMMLGVVVAATLLYWRWRSREARTLLLVVAPMALIFVAGSGSYIRYHLPLFPLIFLLVGLALGRWLSVSRWLQIAVLLLLVVTSARYIRGGQPGLAVALATSTGRMERHEYLARSRVNWPVWDYSNNHLPTGARILLAASAASYYSDHYCFLTDAYRQGRIRFDAWERFLDDLRRERIGYAIVPDAVQSALPRNGPDYLPVRNEMPFVRRLVETYGTLLFRAGGDEVYRLDARRMAGEF